MKLEEVWCGDMYTYVHTYTRNKENQENQEVKEELFILLEIIINTERNMCGIDGGGSGFYEILL